MKARSLSIIFLSLVIAPHRRITDLEHGGHFGVGGNAGPGTYESHESSGRMAVGMMHLMGQVVTSRSQDLQGPCTWESQISHGAMWHWETHHRPAADLVAGKSLLAVRTHRARMLVKIKMALSIYFLEVNFRNDIPFEGLHRLDISDFQTRSREI